MRIKGKKGKKVGYTKGLSLDTLICSAVKKHQRPGYLIEIGWKE